MTDSERRRLEAFIRIRQFGVDNAADFPAGTVGATQFAAIGAVIDEIAQLAGEQAAGVGDSRQTFATKSTARENLREEMYDIVRTARSMQYQFDGIEDKFRMPVNLSDQNLLATARAFHSESLAYDQDFEEYGLDKLFREHLQTAIDAFEAAMNPTGTAIDEQVASTAEIGDAIRRGMIARRILEGVVKNKYRSNVGKLAAWLSASHVERTPVSSKPPTP
jgi:hypothetical protein